MIETHTQTYVRIPEKLKAFVVMKFVYKFVMIYARQRPVKFSLKIGNCYYTVFLLIITNAQLASFNGFFVTT